MYKELTAGKHLNKLWVVLKHLLKDIGKQNKQKSINSEKHFGVLSVFVKFDWQWHYKVTDVQQC